MQGLIGLILLVANVIVTVQIVKGRDDSGRKALWIVLVWILPVIGLVLYFLLGKKNA